MAVTAGKKEMVLREVVKTGEGAPAGAFLARKSGLPLSVIQDALLKGAFRLKRKGQKWIRLRKVETAIGPGDEVAFYYDRDILARIPPAADLVEDRREYTVWFKPPGLMTQGSPWGDHCSLERQAERHFRGRRPIYLVHRLDREASGLVVLGHTKKAAAAFSRLFREGALEKRYRVKVLGSPAAVGEKRTIALPLDGKDARTEFKVIAYDGGKNVSELEVTLWTGRLHQIRRHLEAVGCPVLGDPRYGRGNKNREGLEVRAFSLRFTCPLSGRDVFIRHDPGER